MCESHRTDHILATILGICRLLKSSFWSTVRCGFRYARVRQSERRNSPMPIRAPTAGGMRGFRRYCRPIISTDFRWDSQFGWFSTGPRFGTAKWILSGFAFGRPYSTNEKPIEYSFCRSQPERLNRASARSKIGLIRTFGAGQQAKSFPSGNVLSFGGHGTSPKPFESGLTSA